MCRTKNPVNAAVFFLYAFILGILLSCTQAQQALPPSAPAAPAIVSGDGLLEVSWPDVPEAHSYQVWYTANRSGQVLRSGEDIPGTAHTISGLTNGTLYFVCVRGINEAGAGAESPWSQGTPSAEITAPDSDQYQDRQETLNSRLIGSWRSDYDDGYVISDTALSYNAGYDSSFSFTGDIRYFKKFDDASGVIVIEYTAPPTYNALPGAFFGIYYWGLTPARVYLANTTEINSVPPYAPPETATLEAAIAKFTQADKSQFVAESAVKVQKKQP
jgi:hypothetical protein